MSYMGIHWLIQVQLPKKMKRVDEYQTKRYVEGSQRNAKIKALSDCNTKNIYSSTPNLQSGRVSDLGSTRPFIKNIASLIYLQLVYPYYL